MTQSIKHRLKFYLNFIQVFCDLFSQVLYDWRRFRKFSSYAISIFYLKSNGRVKSSYQLLALIQADAHKIEKALAITNPRPGFGVAVVKRLIANVEEYYQRFSFNSRLEIAYCVLQKYLEFNLINKSLDKDLEFAIKQLEEDIQELKDSKNEAAGVIHFSKESYLKRTKLDLDDFFMNRYSMRQFSDQSLDLADLQKAIYLASKTPSVCNRQCYHAFVAHGKEKASSVLSYQLGNRGFGDQVDSVITVTADLSCFFSSSERNQAWIDGGLFAMSLIYALHSLGIASCPLNWSVNPKRDLALKNASGIPHSHSVIMMIACGHIKDEFTVAQSKRKPMEELCTIMGEPLAPCSL
jgi:nitroreductase